MKNNHLVVGILAHVDAGKTTLAESILYTTGQIRRIGRVDHGDAFLDTYELERSRGITIFSKQAELSLDNKSVTILDTPGHVDFSAEMERTLQVLDYAILVIGGMDGVQGHVLTLWKLLKRYEIPTFIFINKSDQNGFNKNFLLQNLQKKLDSNCIDFTINHTCNDFYESIAECDDALLEQYFNDGLIEHSSIVNSIKNRRIFPCFVGSALKLDGIESFLLNLDEYTICTQYSTDFSAHVYKISRDKQGNRLTHVKLTGGSLKVKEQVKPDEKVDQIRIYSGDSCEMVQEISAGRICAFTGLESTYAGENLGSEFDSLQPVLTPVLNYALILPQGCDTHSTYLKLKQLEEEQPELRIIWNKSLGEIHAQVMGDVQIEILKSIIHDRFQLDIEFGIGNIVYKETILNEVVGCGHYEPLRHYAEVRLLMEPAPRGSGLIFESKVSEDILDRNWQRLIMTHLEEKTHKGVLTGSDITDIKITIINGRAHNKHTEGGDFRQATYRAVRQGLKKATCQLLEPVYEFQLEVPSEHIGRAMSDIQFMHGNFEPMTMDGDIAIIKGICPVATMINYQKEVAAYTKGNGILFCTLKGYEPCHNSEFVINEIDYDSEKDIDNPTGSVFCDHGAGFVVPWHKVDEYMHTEFKQKREASSVETYPTIDTEEIDAILARTFYANRKMDNFHARTISAPQSDKRIRKPSSLPEILLVDGYNIIFAWKELKELAKVNIDGARGKLTDILCNYQGYRKNIIILVFDGYKVPGNPGEIIKHHNIYIIYTKEAETADQYIEKAVHDISSKYDIKVATSDAMEQLIIMGQGALRISAQELYQEILITNQEMQELHMERTKKSGSYLFEVLTEDMADFMDDVRMGRREFEDLETK